MTFTRLFDVASPWETQANLQNGIVPAQFSGDRGEQGMGSGLEAAF